MVYQEQRHRGVLALRGNEWRMGHWAKGRVGAAGDLHDAVGGALVGVSSSVCSARSRIQDVMPHLSRDTHDGG